MSARYKKLFSLEHRLYASHAPVLIESGALLLEQESGTLLCQLCFRSIQDRPVKAIRAVVQMLDAQGLPMGKLVEHRYQELDLQREDICGRDIAIVLPSSEAASFTAKILQVSFADGEVWAEKAPWEPLPEQYTLEDHFVSAEEVYRYQRRFGEDCVFDPLETEELWFCTCGAVNANTEGRCHRCRRKRSALLGKGPELPPTEDAEEAEYRAQPFLPEKLPPRIRGLAIGAAALVLLGILALVLIPRLHGGSTKADTAEMPAVAAAAVTEDPADAALQAAYEEALALQTKAEADPDDYALYLSAAEAFEALGAYEDSADRAAACREQIVLLNEAVLQEEYAAAQKLLSQRRYSEAREAFLTLGDYEDSAEQADEALYQKALGLFRYVEDNSVRGITASLSADPEEESLVAIPRERLLKLGQEGLRDLEDLFGEDPVVFTAAEEESEMLPLPDALVSLLEPLGDYKDSKELAAKLPELVDQSDAFFELCEAGELEAARDWLEAWDKPFEDKELWLERVDRCLAVDGTWYFLNGDPSLVASIGGIHEKYYTIVCQVRLSTEGAVLRILLDEQNETGPELFAELDNDCFRLEDGAIGYLVQLSPGGSLGVNKTENGNIIGGAAFGRSWG